VFEKSYTSSGGAGGYISSGGGYMSSGGGYMSFGGNRSYVTGR